jgi:hypothetical protein
MPFVRKFGKPATAFAVFTCNPAQTAWPNSVKFCRLITDWLTSWRKVVGSLLIDNFPTFYESLRCLQINGTKCTILFNIFIYLFISILYMFRANIDPSSREVTVSMRHWYLSLCTDGVWCAGWSFTPTSKTRRHPDRVTPTSRTDATRTEWQIPVPHTYSNFYSW